MSRLELAARDIRTARETLAYIMLNARAVTYQASMAGISEVQIARTLGVNRQTVRHWLGKPR